MIWDVINKYRQAACQLIERSTERDPVQMDQSAACTTGYLVTGY